MAMPSTGALLINPRRRRKTKRKSGTSKAARSRAAKLGWARRKRAKTRRNTTKGQRRVTARRAYMRKRNSTKRGGVRKTARRAYARRNSTKRGGVRKTARRAYTRRRANSTRRGMVRKTARRAYTRKRNPNILNAISQPLKRIPVVGGIASDAVQLGIPAAFGAISIEPVMFGLKYGGQYLPKPLQKLSFTIGGMVMGALVRRFLPASPEIRKQFAVALATAGGAIDYYRMKTGQGTVQSMAAAEQAGWGELEAEAMDGLGALEIAAEGMSGYGELELAVDGFGDTDFDDEEFDFDDEDDDMDGYGSLELATDGFGYGELELAMSGYSGHTPNFSNPGTELMGFGDASAADAIVSGDYMTDYEADAILAGPGVFLGSAYGAPPVGSQSKPGDAASATLNAGKKKQRGKRQRRNMAQDMLRRQMNVGGGRQNRRNQQFQNLRAQRQADQQRAKQAAAERAKMEQAYRDLQKQLTGSETGLAERDAQISKLKGSYEAAIEQQEILAKKAEKSAKEAADLAAYLTELKAKGHSDSEIAKKTEEALKQKIKELEDTQAQTNVQYAPSTVVGPGAQTATVAAPIAYTASPTVASPVAAQPYGRWWWLVKLYGYERAMQVAALPEPQRAAYIRQLRDTAIRNHPGLLAFVMQPPPVLPPPPMVAAPQAYSSWH